MSGRKAFNPRDYNPVANPDLPRTNSPWKFWGLLIAVGLACLIAWFAFRPPVRVSQPTLSFAGERATATVHAVNKTRKPVQLSLRFVLAHTSVATSSGPARFDVIEQRDIKTRIPAGSSERVSCEFSRSPQVAYPPKAAGLRVEVQILSRETIDA